MKYPSYTLKEVPEGQATGKKQVMLVSRQCLLNLYSTEIEVVECCLQQTLGVPDKPVSVNDLLDVVWDANHCSLALQSKKMSPQPLWPHLISDVDLEMQGILMEPLFYSILLVL